MLALTKVLQKNSDFRHLLTRINTGGCPALVSGLSSVHKAHIIAAVRNITGRPVLALCSDELELGRMQSDILALTSEQPLKLTARDFTFANVDGVSRNLEHERIRTLYAMAAGNAPVITATPDGLMQRTIPKQSLLNSGQIIEQGKSYKIDDIIMRLLACGYRRCDQVEGAGQFARRGGILDFFSPAFENPVRCEFFGDEIDNMGVFDVLTQRRIENIESAEILPAAESLVSLHPGGTSGFLDELNALYRRVSKRKNPLPQLLDSIQGDIARLENELGFQTADRYMQLIYGEIHTAASYIAEGTIVFLCEPGRLDERAKNYAWQMSQDIETVLENGQVEGTAAVFFAPWNECLAETAKHPAVMLDSFRASTYPLAPKVMLNVVTKQLPSYGGSLPTAAGDIVHYLKDGYSAAVLCSSERKAGIMKEYLEGTGIPCALDFSFDTPPEPGTCVITEGAVSAGMEYPVLKLAVITEGQLTAVPPKKSTQKKKVSKNRERLASYSDLSPGDLVVHEQHGIGRFVGIFKLPVDGVQKDYVKISYSGADSLYVPATQLGMVSKYIGAGEERPVKLSKLGGADWQKAKAKARKAAKELAIGLIELYAERVRRPGHAFSPDSGWQKEFEDSFEYTETDDQMRSINEIKSDMEKAVPMDRLLCGDVGFGKTEVALRAVMKCILDGKQAAILVPTTVLAQQHYLTAVRRFANYPVHIEVLSRFRTAAQMKQSLKNIKNGKADIAIGTHRLIQKDVKFSNLGLLIIDEEQRFGVSHKEKLKDMARQVDVLTLTATPIPRTLNMAMAGIRDMSTIEEPPSGRHPVQTYVLEHNWAVLCDAIRREVSRGGQVYYLHNRVDSIDRTAARIASMLDGVAVASAHGQMDEESLSSVMERVASGAVQVLVCTTIIETGIDIPNVNTLIIEDADHLGLAQLHQIRGRVGRSSRHAFAYFTYRQGKILSEVANKRLSTIREFAEFNSGFKIAMRDLEIRGAGNLLGAEQSGHMLSVGFDMYLKLLEEAVLEAKGEKPRKRAECSADLTVSANIPEEYVSSPELRMDLYRRIALIESREEADDMTDELIDRFGEPPKSVSVLMQVALLRADAAEAGICEITQKAGRLYFKLADFDMARISAMYSGASYRGKIKVEAGTDPSVSLKLVSGNDVITQAEGFVREYKMAGNERNTDDKKNEKK